MMVCAPQGISTASSGVWPSTARSRLTSAPGGVEWRVAVQDAVAAGAVAAGKLVPGAVGAAVGGLGASPCTGSVGVGGVAAGVLTWRGASPPLHTR
jgi:hypothetical protein